MSADSIDGGVRRAGDIIKAVALGAKAVGIGRPFLCACTLSELEHAQRCRYN